MSRIVEGELKEGEWVWVQKESEEALFNLVRRKVNFIVAGFAFVDGCGWFNIDSWK